MKKDAALDRIRKRKAALRGKGGKHTTASTAVKEGVRARTRNPRLGWARALRGGK